MRPTNPLVASLQPPKQAGLRAMPAAVESPAAGDVSPRAAAPRVHGLALTALTQCAHWHSPLDIVAIKHKCCGAYYACISCHDALAGHISAVWPRSEQATAKAVLCGWCSNEMTVAEYLQCGNVCPRCEAAFNPGCKTHHGLYFEVNETSLCKTGI